MIALSVSCIEPNLHMGASCFFPGQVVYVCLCDP